MLFSKDVYIQELSTSIIRTIQQKQTLRKRWSVDYVASGGILLVDVIIIALMIWNRRNWQSYLMWQIAMILFSLIPAILYLIGLEHNFIMAFLPLIVSVFLFIGTLMIGGRRAGQELYRRFHI